MSTRALPVGILAALGVSMSACAGGADTDTTVIARVGRAAITRASLDHWMAVIAPQHVVPDAPSYANCMARERARAPGASTVALRDGCDGRYEALKQRALDFLIAARWVIGEAADRGVGVSARQVARALAEKRRALPNRDLGELLSATGQTRSDIELEIGTQLAAARLYELQAHSEHRVTQTDIARYYRNHVGQFRRPERRDFYIVEDLSSITAARQRIKEIEHGRDIASFSLHESLTRKAHQLSSPAIVKAIFTSRPGELVGPIAVSAETYYLIEVNRIIPPGIQQLADARRSIEKHLAGPRHQRTLRAFVSAWATKWIAKTDCKTGYVTWRCRQYTGPRPPTDTLHLLDAGAA